MKVENWTVRMGKHRDERGEWWQVDVILPNGDDHHAIGDTPAGALIEMAMYLVRIGVSK